MRRTTVAKRGVRARPAMYARTWRVSAGAASSSSSLAEGEGEVGGERRARKVDRREVRRAGSREVWKRAGRSGGGICCGRGGGGEVDRAKSA